MEADGEYYDYIDDSDDEDFPPASGTGNGAVPKEAALYHSASPNASPSDEHSVVRETGHLILSTDDLYEDPEAQTFIVSVLSDWQCHALIN